MTQNSYSLFFTAASYITACHLFTWIQYSFHNSNYIVPYEITVSI